jgi:hypothetical protein
MPWSWPIPGIAPIAGQEQGVRWSKVSADEQLVELCRQVIRKQRELEPLRAANSDDETVFAASDRHATLGMLIDMRATTLAGLRAQAETRRSFSKSYPASDNDCLERQITDMLIDGILRFLPVEVI